MQRILALLLVSLGFGLARGAIAQSITVPPPPEKQVVIYNNSEDTIYPMLSIGAKIGNPDLWMQAQFVSFFPDKYPNYPPFPTTLVYRAFVNPDRGIPPHESVKITVPFYTQLQPVTSANLGVDNDQFIDWWNAGRVYLFDGSTALKSARITDGIYENTQHTPTPITPVPGAVVPVCAAASGNCVVSVESYAIDPPFGIPFQLQEYTFASAMGPPTDMQPATIDLSYVNYNVSSLDSVHLPVAMGPLGNSAVPYVGSTESIPDFLAHLRGFAKDGQKWPDYVPVYFDDPTTYPTYPKVFNAACSLTPFNTAYLLPKVPGTFNVLVESYRNPPPIPPVLTSNPPDFPLTTCVPSPPPPFMTPELGTTGQAVAKLWDKCTASAADTSPTCKGIRIEHDFFLNNYIKACKQQPSSLALIEAIYGWVPITDKGCTGGALKDSAGFKEAIMTYCSLQYNYLDPNVPSTDIFNPYTALIHQTLQSSAYAFSIDDEVSFKHVKGEGVIITIAGPAGLENETPSPLPTAGNYTQQCRTS